MNSYTLTCVLAASACCHAFTLPGVSLTRDIHLPSFSTIKRFISNSTDLRQNGQTSENKNRYDSRCPSVWNDVSEDLTSRFLANGICTDDARAAIRASFHDCFEGTCDGSLVLADECTRKENDGLADWAAKLTTLQAKYDVGMADLIQFAGAHATVTCPKGPTVPVFVGRKDSKKPSVKGNLPPANATGDALHKAFVAKGFTAEDLAALIGAHTTSKQSFVHPAEANLAQDTTPGIWDVNYYRETIDGDAPFTFQADKNLAKHPIVGPQFRRFVDNQFGWNLAYVAGMKKMSMLGVKADGLIDCTSALPQGTRRRDFRAVPINARGQ